MADTRVTNGATISNTYSNGPPAVAAATGGGPVWNMWASLLGASVFDGAGYVYTWVTAYGEEGPPSPPAMVNGWSNATWTVSLFQPEPENMGVPYVDPADGLTKQPLRNITTTRLYRSISNQAGQGTYFLVAEFPVTQAVYEDTLGDDVVALNRSCVVELVRAAGGSAGLQGVSQRDLRRLEGERDLVQRALSSARLAAGLCADHGVSGGGGWGLRAVDRGLHPGLAVSDHRRQSDRDGADQDQPAGAVSASRLDRHHRYDCALCHRRTA